MKITLVCPRYYPDIGGVETHVKEIGQRLVKRGYHVSVICTDPTKKLPTEEILNGVKVKRFWSIAPNDAFFIAPKIYFYIKKTHCDVIHAHSYHALPAFFAVLSKKSRKFVFSPHYDGKVHTAFRNVLHTPYKVLGSKIFRNSDKVICVSLFEKKLIINKFGISKDKLVCIPNGIDLEEFIIENNVKKKKEILYCGRLEEYKGVQHIITALQYLEDYNLVIIGKGPYEEELRKLASEINVNDRIEWKKDLPRKELLKQYRSSQIFVFLSSLEAFGITVAEALASRTPCIVANGSALKEFVDDKICFGLNHPINAKELSEKIIEVSEMKINSFDLPKEKIKSWDEVVDECEKVYEELTK